MKPHFYAMIGQRFDWMSQTHALTVIATPTGWLCYLHLGDKAQQPQLWQVPDKDHSLNPRALWNDQDWLTPFTDTIQDPAPHQKLAERLWALENPSDNDPALSLLADIEAYVPTEFEIAFLTDAIDGWDVKPKQDGNRARFSLEGRNYLLFMIEDHPITA